MGDRYIKGVLTVIAGALVYLCVVLTPWPAALAQTAPRPGDPTGPAQVVVVGWRAPASDRVPIALTTPVPVTVNGGQVQVSGQVTTERSSGRADRVVLAGWEEHAAVDRFVQGQFRPIEPAGSRGSQGVPVTVMQK